MAGWFILPFSPSLFGCVTLSRCPSSCPVPWLFTLIFGRCICIVKTYILFWIHHSEQLLTLDINGFKIYNTFPIPKLWVAVIAFNWGILNIVKRMIPKWPSARFWRVYTDVTVAQIKMDNTYMLLKGPFQTAFLWMPKINIFKLIFGWEGSSSIVFISRSLLALYSQSSSVSMFAVHTYSSWTALQRKFWWVRLSFKIR